MSSFDSSQPQTNSVPLSAPIRGNFSALAEAVFGGNLVRDSTFQNWAAGDSAAPAHYVLYGTGAAVARVTGQIGSNACRVTSGGAAAAGIQQTIISSSNFPTTIMRGREFSIGVRARGSGASVWRPWLYDGITYTYGSYNTGTSAEWITVTKTLDATSATQIVCGVEVIASGSPNVIIDGIVVVEGSVAPGMWVPGHARRAAFTVPVEGTQVVTTTVFGLYWDPPVPVVILEVRLRVSTAPTGSALIVDVNKNGTSMFATRPQIAASATTGSAAPDAATYSLKCFTRGDYLTIDIDQIGSTVAGSNLNIEIVYRVFGAELDQFVGLGEVN